jgi:peptidoglycan hydrolase CwlO-like protein
MNRRALSVFAVSVLLISAIAFFPGAARAQSTAPTPAAQAQDPAPSGTSPAPAQPAKKVWTNDDVSDLHANSVISTLGNSSAKPAKTAATRPAPNSKNKDATWYRNQITKLQEQLPPIDQKISDLQTVINGGQVNEVRHYGGNKIDDWHDELARLQTQREGIVAKISALQDEARHNGVSPNELP